MPRKVALAGAPSTESSADDYTEKLCRAAILQIAHETGFTGGIRDSSVEKLSDLMSGFIQELGKKSARVANSGGRSQVGLLEVMHSLESIFHITMDDLERYETDSMPMPSIVSDGLSNIIPTDVDNPHLQSMASSMRMNQTVLIDQPKIPLDLMDGQFTGDKSHHHHYFNRSSSGSGGSSLTTDSSTTTGVTRKKRRFKESKILRHIPYLCPDYPHEFRYKCTPAMYDESEADKLDALDPRSSISSSSVRLSSSSMRTSMMDVDELEGKSDTMNGASQSGSKSSAAAAVAGSASSVDSTSDQNMDNDAEPDSARAAVFSNMSHKTRNAMDNRKLMKEHSEKYGISLNSITDDNAGKFASVMTERVTDDDLIALSDTVDSSSYVVSDQISTSTMVDSSANGDTQSSKFTVQKPIP